MRRALAPLLLAALAVAGCSMLADPFATQPAGRVPVDPAQPPPGDPSRFVEAKAAWTSNGIDDYTWQVTSFCECALNGPVEITVVDGAPTKVVTQQGEVPLENLVGFPLTVDDVLDHAVNAVAGGGSVDVTWGQVPGVPAAITIDPVPGAIDDEINLLVDRLDPAP
jgi:hypothetical protein